MNIYDGQKLEERNRILEERLETLDKSYRELESNYHKLLVRVFHANNMKNFREEYLELKKENKELKEQLKISQELTRHYDGIIENICLV